MRPDDLPCYTGDAHGMNNVTLVRPSPRHAADFLEAVRRSRNLHRGWVTPPRDHDAYTAYVKGLRKANKAGFFIMTGSREIAGVINVSEIVRGSFLSAYLGYYALQPFAARGLMRQGLQAIIAVCFGEMNLHRLEANIRPENVRSIALVSGLGFRYEGFSPRYLKVCGRWRDHERWALLADDRGGKH